MRAYGSKRERWRTLADHGLSALAGGLGFGLLIAAGTELFGPAGSPLPAGQAAAPVPSRASAVSAQALPELRSRKHRR